MKKRITPTQRTPFNKCHNCNKYSIQRNCMNCSMDCCLICSNQCVYCKYIVCEDCYNDWNDFGEKIVIEKNLDRISRINGNDKGVFTYFVCYKPECIEKGLKLKYQK